MSDRYCVFGNPVHHSRSPAIHRAFAAQCAQDVSYTAILAPIGGFPEAVGEFAATGGRGANVTLPFKEEAFALASRLSERARIAGAVNTLDFAGPGIRGDNTDGAGLVQDLTGNLGLPIAGRRILLLGAGGAARGVLGPLLDAGPRLLVVANRTVARAQALARRFAGVARVQACGFDDLGGESFDLVINATSASLAGDVPPLPKGVFSAGALAYDMVYGDAATPFLGFARSQGVERLADGLGMLVEQAAESFLVWRGVRPQTAPVIAMLRAARTPAGQR